MTKDPLFQPYQLKHLTLKNRIMSTSHEPAYGEEGMPKDRYRLYHREKARGGMALTMTAGSALVSADSPSAFGNLHAYDDRIVPWMKAIADDCHEMGCAVMIQLTHLGRRGGFASNEWLPVLSASAVREAAHRTIPKAMEDWDIDRIVGDYASAAARMQEAGLDGIELEAYGHLLDSFWSPATNHRDDEWGGDLDNRLRFTWRVLDAIRASCGSDFLVGLRLVADEQMEHGLGRAEGLEISRRLAASGKVDFLNLIRGHIDTEAGLTEVIPIQGMASAPHLDFAGEVRQASGLPMFHAARIPDVATARHAIAAGKLDMVGMTRAHIADPHIARKIREGAEDRIRPCVGATYCLDRIYEGGGALCIHNAATGREETMPHDIPAAPSRKKVIVVGAGPGGLEAARVAAERGHEVVVYEAADEPGGQVNLLTRLPRRREMHGLIAWRLDELARLGVSIHTNHYAEADEIIAARPDAVVVATGGMPPELTLPGGDLALSSWDLISGAVKPAGRVLIWDDGAGHAGMTAAEIASDAGAEVELVTPERSLAPEIGGMNHVPYMRAFHRNGVRVTINTRLSGLARDGNGLTAQFGSDFLASHSESRAVDQVFTEAGTMPLDEVYFALKPFSRNLGAVDYAALLAGDDPFGTANPKGTFTLYRIGDAVSARNIHAAIYDALRLGLHI